MNRRRQKFNHKNTPLRPKAGLPSQIADKG